MRVTKSLLVGISALALGMSAAFAHEESMQTSDQLSEPMAVIESYDVYYVYPSLDSSAQSEPYDVYYIYPVEVEEAYVLVPSVDTEMPQG